MPNRLFLTLLIACIQAASFASQPKSLADLPDPNPDAEKAGFVIPEGIEATLFASDPMLQKPVQMNWDAQGRLWVVSSTTYPQVKPGEDAKDQVVVLEDTDNDGKADKSTVFAEELHIPTAVIPGDGGVYVANSTEVLFLKDTNGDLKADERTVLLSGFGTEDTHHLLHTMRFGPEGLLYFLQSIYIHSHIETPYGMRRLMGGGVWEFRPETRRLELISKGLINPWGFEFDRWGQSFATDGAGGEGLNYIFPGSVFATSPGAKRILHGMSPGQPKHAGLDVIDDPRWPESWRGSWVTNDFRGNRVNRFTLTPSGSGYVAKQEADVLACNHRAFRPIDVKMGPDGAMYIADWYNPIIQHGEVDFRDARRDHVHGRIWRLAPKGLTKSEKPKIVGAPVPELLEMLKSDTKWTRHFAKREMRDRGASEVMPLLKAWVEALPKDSPNYWHDLLEATWTRECLNRFSAGHWRTLYSSPDPRVRAAALRILSHRWRELPDAMQVLKQAIADDNAQVRLWALAVLADMRTPTAFDLALHALDHEMDENLDFLLELIAREQADVWLPAYTKGVIKLSNPKHLVYAMKATGRSDALKPLFAALKSGNLAAEDATAVLAVAGDAADAAQAAQMAAMVDDPAMSKHVTGLMDALVKAATARGVKPEGAEALVEAWFASADAEIVQRAAVLAGFWKVEKARGTLTALVLKTDAPPPVRAGAVQGLTKLGGAKSRDFFDQLFTQHENMRALAVQGLADVGPALAAKRAVEFLITAKTAAEATPILAAFLKNKQLPGVLAKELEGKTIPEFAAVEGIRMVSSRGVQGPLLEALRKAGQVKQMDRPLTAEEMTALVAKVKAQGNAARGEAVYRRQQLLCQSCHAIGDAGGVLGPNLVSAGASAPVDYLIESLLEPSKKVKEGYHMIVLTTKDGQVVAGGLVQDGNDEVVVRDPANQLHKVPKAKIASRQMSPASMMPPGLTASLREDEFVDLVRFLSELGREGDYKIKPNTYVRTWKVMGPMDQESVDHVRHVGLPALHDAGHPFPWQIAYSEVSGKLPLDGLAFAAKMYPWFPKIASFSLKLDTAGKVKLGLSSVKAINVVVDDKVLPEVTPELTLDLPAGSHRVTLVIGREAAELKDLRVELLDGAAQFLAQ